MAQTDTQSRGDVAAPAVVYAAKSTEDKHASIPTQLADGRAQSDADADGPRVALALGDNQSTRVAPLRRNQARSSR